MKYGQSRGGNAISWIDGEWHDDEPAVAKATDHAMWLGSAVFDGARSMAGKVPDLEAHCARAIRSARIMGMAPGVTTEDIVDLSREGIQKFPDDAELYICPLFYASGGFVVPDPDSTHFVLTVEEAALPEPTGFKACLSPFRRPAADMAPTEAKAACLYPNVSRAVADANGRGFDTGVMLDPDGDVAEFSSANLFMVKDGVVHTPEINGTFLNGITRQRVIQLLREAGVEVVERRITYDDLTEADELFATGNYSKVVPCTQLDGRALPRGPMFRETRDMYFSYADAC
ncbi:branched-chain amino acid aminotransferase [Thalassospiraceae bacterium LMO-SO8]|nr:branched-chain amino acid aminotransferase [Alphaproteobacteria bacterium LMO-S08]WND77913.1 branched-chain amino acid aminotransferase [Thalassospiraceae bacterium LMO-SO8]